MSSKKSKTATAKPVRRPLLIRVFGGLFRLIRTILFRLIGWGIVVAAAVVLYFYLQLPDAKELLDGRESGSVAMVDRHGDIFAWRGEQGGVVGSAQMSEDLRNAVVATEDKRFYWHMGISPRGILGAIRINLSEGRSALSGHGGSTITQQVAKLVFLSEESTWRRKVLEIPYALAMELAYTKEEILSIYMNRAYLGASATGFEAAAQRYFGISAREVDVQQAAMLAGLLTAPSRYAPTRDLGRAQNRSQVILRLMHEQGYIDDTVFAQARANPAELSESARRRAGGYFADWVMEAGPEFLIEGTREDVEISTTFDPAIQEAAEQALFSVFDDLVREGSEAQAAIVVLSADGAVRGMVGGRAIGGAGTFNRATQALRQPGSAFKPFVYAAAVESGMHPTDYLNDAPLTINIPGSGPWSPQNYGRSYRGPMPMYEALARSTNTIAVRVSEEVGRAEVIEVAHDLGLDSDLTNSPALALGASETTLLDLTGAYASILNQGFRAEPYGLTEVRLRHGGELLLSEEPSLGKRAISEQTAGYVTWMMNQVVEAPYGTGRRAALGDRPVAGKTGTTDAARDAWFIGFSGDYVVGVWMGYDDNTPLTGVTGGGLPAEIWRRTMLGVHEGMPVSALPMLVPNTPSYQDNIATAGNDVVRRIEDAAQDVDDGLSGIVEGLLRGLLGGN
ncbi:penicillin-binding protein 1A [Monaibacterium marinum]|uniref:peptidoglycan glycosyltransferase n=1 Tax=Pontivivens marinum TaxID=1690039 RepID=A0A2C9CPG4_9RHOB|nr:transglycosylase domain-containing protein [Monaibacterium marinum]SOH93113.1 penicillin-binding protein 1A [Monaibacterium marinum]